jgi:hypothetical protein
MEVEDETFKLYSGSRAKKTNNEVAWRWTSIEVVGFYRQHS